MLMRLTLVAVALVVLLSGCGHSSSQRSAVAAYLTHVNKIEAQLAEPLANVTATDNEFARAQGPGGSSTSLTYASENQKLNRAWSQIVGLRGRLASLETPVSATRLRALLLHVIDLQAGLTREMAKLVLFLPQFNVARQPLAGSTKRLEVALSRQTVGPSGVAAVYAAKAAALRQFKSEADSILTRLRKLQPPAVAKPEYEDQIAALDGMSSSAGQLAGALTHGPTGNLQQLLAQFDRAATLNQTIGAQKARISAIRAYDGQSAKLTKLTQEADRERYRLASTLT